MEKQIGLEEHEMAIIRLKRTRNSFLNVSTLLPPEILGNIFRWNDIPDGDFGGLPKDSHNFLLVCHHWFEVASHTPDLWSFWGNNVQDWAHWHARCGTAPLDLVLAKYPSYDFGDELHNALQDCSTRDLIRRVHLRGTRVADLLNSVVSSIVTEGEGTRSNCVESFVLESVDRWPVDVSAFFSQYRLPKLQHLCLSGCRISSWDWLKSHTMALTTLELGDVEQSPTLTQLFAIISSNPLLQNLALSPSSVPHADGDRSSPQVPLHHLKNLHLRSYFCSVFGLLNQLELPDKMDNLRLTLHGCSNADISNTLGPFLGDCIRRRDGFSGGGLGLLAYPYPCYLDFRVGDARKGDGSAEVVWFVEVWATTDGELGEEEANRLCFDLISHTPREQVISLQTSLPILYSEELCIEMRDLTYLHLTYVDLLVRVVCRARHSRAPQV